MLSGFRHESYKRDKFLTARGMLSLIVPFLRETKVHKVIRQSDHEDSH